MATPKKRKNRKLVVALLAVPVVAFAGYRVFHKSDDAIPVQVEKATRRDLTETVVANGRIQPVTQVVISPEVAGEIIELPVKEGQLVKKGDLLVQIKPDNYKAASNSAEASYQSALGSKSQADAELERAESDFKRNQELSKSRLISASVFQEFTTAYRLAQIRQQSAIHAADQARFALDRANDDLSKTTIKSPIDGTVTKLKSQLGERVLGTSFNMGTEMMTVARLDEMEARVDIGEIDVVLIEVGQNAQIEVDAFKDRKFKGTVSAIANASKGPALGASSSSAQQEAPKFEVKIRVLDQGAFRPGMSVTAEIETRSRKAALTVPIQSVTARLPTASASPAPGAKPAATGTKPSSGAKPKEIVFALEGDHVKMIPVKTGISDSNYFEITEGLSEGQQVVSGSYKAISKDLDDGKKVKLGTEAPAVAKE